MFYAYAKNQTKISQFFVEENINVVVDDVNIWNAETLNQNDGVVYPMNTNIYFNTTKNVSIFYCENIDSWQLSKNYKRLFIDGVISNDATEISDGRRTLCFSVNPCRCYICQGGPITTMVTWHPTKNSTQNFYLCGKCFDSEEKIQKNSNKIHTYNKKCSRLDSQNNKIWFNKPGSDLERIHDTIKIGLWCNFYSRITIDIDFFVFSKLTSFKRHTIISGEYTIHCCIACKLLYKEEDLFTACNTCIAYSLKIEVNKRWEHYQLINYINKVNFNIELIIIPIELVLLIKTIFIDSCRYY